jgi:ribosome modulation factor
MNCYAEGYNAFTVGIKLSDNPYSDLYRRAEWTKGWLSAKINLPLNFQECK